MFEKGIVQKVMIMVTLIMTGALVSLAVRATPFMITVGLVIVALINGASGYLSLTRLDSDAQARGMIQTEPKRHV